MYRSADAVVQQARIELQDAVLEGSLEVPLGAEGVVVFAHGSGSSRHSPRNRFVAEHLRSNAIGTLLVDLLTLDEDADPDRRFDIDLLARRLRDVAEWLWTTRSPSPPLGFFGASTGAAAALRAAADLGPRVRAVVSRGGRVDLAEEAVAAVQAPTLLIVGGEDVPVVAWNRAVYAQLRVVKKMVVVPGAGHLFEEYGALEAVAQEAAAWFKTHLHD